MAIRQILLVLPTYPDPPPERTLASALFLARHLEAGVTALVPQLSDDPKSWPVLIGASPLDLPGLMREAVTQSQRNAETLTAGLAKMAGSVPLDLRRGLTGLYAPAEPVVELARLHDLVVLPFPESDSYERNLVQPMLFGGGRPVMLLPSGGRALTALNVTVTAWDYGREAARALADAMPILGRARKNHILTVAGEKPAGTAATRSDLEKFLSRHGVPYQLEKREIGEDEIGSALLAEAEARDADLLVMGGYGHSRMREWALGGATRRILRNPALPVLLSH